MINLDDLISDLVNSNVPLSAVLRKAYVLAREIDEPTFLDWIKCELNGYDLSQWEKRNDFPEYRKPPGDLRGRGPFGMVKPIRFEDQAVADKLSRPWQSMAIGEVETLVSSIKPGGYFEMPLHPANAVVLRKAAPYEIEPFLVYSPAAFVSILEAVRNRLLELLMDLKEKFPKLGTEQISQETRKEVANLVIQVINNPSSCQISAGQQQTIAWPQFSETLKAQLDSKGVSYERTKELLDILEEAQKASPGKEKKGLPKRALNYIEQNKGWITGTILDSIKIFFG